MRISVAIAVSTMEMSHTPAQTRAVAVTHFGRGRDSSGRPMQSSQSGGVPSEPHFAHKNVPQRSQIATAGPSCTGHTAPSGMTPLGNVSSSSSFEFVR